MKELIFNLGVDMDEIRKELGKTQEVPGREIPDISKYQEQLGTFRHDLGKALQQVEVLERKVREGDQRFSQLQAGDQRSVRENPSRKGIRGSLKSFSEA